MARPGSLVPAAALVGLLLFDVLRVWLPSLLFIATDAASTSVVVMGAIAVGVAAIAPLASAALGAGIARIGWSAGIALLVGGRLLLQMTDGGTLQLLTSSCAIVGAGLCLGALGGGAASGHRARVGVLIGVIGSIAIHAALGTTDLAWRHGVAAWAALAVLIVATLLAAWEARSLLRPHGSEAGPAWPWWLFGPILVLLGVLTAPPGRVAIATGWDNALVVAIVIAAHGMAIMAAIGGRRLGPVLGGTVGAGLVLVGTVASVRAASPLAVAAQVLLCTGIGLVVGSMDRSNAVTSVGRRAVAAAGFPLAFVVIGFAYYAGYDLALPFPGRVVLLLAALIVATAGFVATRGPRPALRERGLARQALMVALATALTAGVGASLVSSPGPQPPLPGAPGSEVSVALLNLHMGFDPQGRMSLEEVGDLLAGASPDIVVLNEVDRGWLTTGGHDSLRLLQDRLGLPYAFGPAADEVWGNAVLSRYPLTEVAVERLPRGGDAMSRSQLITVLEVEPEQRIGVIATHLSHVDSQGDTRLPQARAVAGTLARLQERGVPVIIAGDLNAQPGEPELATFDEVADSVITDGAATFPSWEPARQIDHILVTEEFDVLGSTVPKVELSDHLPVFARLRLDVEEATR